VEKHLVVSVGEQVPIPYLIPPLSEQPLKKTGSAVYSHRQILLNFVVLCFVFISYPLLVCNENPNPPPLLDFFR